MSHIHTHDESAGIASGMILGIVVALLVVILVVFIAFGGFGIRGDNNGGSGGGGQGDGGGGDTGGAAPQSQRFEQPGNFGHDGEIGYIAPEYHLTVR